MGRPRTLTPKLRQHANGSACCDYNGKTHYFGPYRAKESHRRYRLFINQLNDNGGIVPQEPDDLLVAELCVMYTNEMKRRLMPSSGHKPPQLYRIENALNPLREDYGDMTVGEFGAKHLTAYVSKLVRMGKARSTINGRRHVILAAVRWAESRGAIPEGTYGKLSIVEKVQHNTPGIADPRNLKPASSDQVNAIMPHLSPTLRAMVLLQVMCGVRPGEACILRRCDIDTTTTPWLIQLSHHKTAHRGKKRIVSVPPVLQPYLTPFLQREAEQLLFNPADSATWYREQRRLKRKTPLSCGNRAGTNVKRNPKRTPNDRFTTQTYARAIARACEKAEVDHLGPNAFRKTAASWFRKHFDGETARIALGHSCAGLTDAVYAERDYGKVTDAMLRLPMLPGLQLPEGTLKAEVLQ